MDRYYIWYSREFNQYGVSDSDGRGFSGEWVMVGHYHGYATREEAEKIIASNDPILIQY